MRILSRFLLLATALVVAACAPPGSGGSAVGQSGAEAQPQRTLTILVKVEPLAATTNVDLSGGVNQSIVGRLFGAGLAHTDHRQVPQPYLADALPQLNTDTWKVSADGRMQTTYRLRPNLAWHDGMPLRAEDFSFAHQVYRDPQAGSLFDPARTRHIEEIAISDPQTLVFHWRRPLIEAGALEGGKGGFAPMPRHVLEEIFGRDPATIVSHPYWTTEYLGLGPYRLERWEPGAFLAGGAFDQHALGRPKIDRVKVIWNGDPNVALATMLGNNAHLAGDDALRFSQGALLKKEWADGRGAVIFDTTSSRYIQMQFRPEQVNPKAMLDVRVRRALAHTIDKQGFVDGLLEGQGFTADTLVPRERDYYPALELVMARYPYDLQRSEQLMGEVGFTRGSDGFYRSSAGESFAPEVRGEQQNELVILVDGWRRAGFNASISVTPPALATDNEYRAFLPALAVTKSSVADRTVASKYATETIATPENRYGGTNKGGYSNPEYDRLYTTFTGSLDREEQSSLMVQMLRMASEDLPGLPLYYDLRVTAHVSPLHGPLSSNFWNIHEWVWRS